MLVSPCMFTINVLPCNILNVVKFIICFDLPTVVPDGEGQMILGGILLFSEIAMKCIRI